MGSLKGNGLGFVLLAIGLVVVLAGHYARIDKLADSGFSLLGMAGLALDPKHVASPKDETHQ